MKQVDGVTYLSGEDWDNEFAKLWRERLRIKNEENKKAVELIAMAMASEQREIK